MQVCNTGDRRGGDGRRVWRFWVVIGMDLRGRSIFRDGYEPIIHFNDCWMNGVDSWVFWKIYDFTGLLICGYKLLKAPVMDSLRNFYFSVLRTRTCPIIYQYLPISKRPN